MELGNFDVILGMKWLATLGETSGLGLPNHVAQGGRHGGDPSLSKTSVTMKSMMKAFWKDGEGVLLELGCLSAEAVEVKIPNNLQGVLTDFKAVFKEPCGLPPHQRRDHTITLQPGFP